MIISNNDLISVCNYLEYNNPSLPKSVFSFMDFLETPNDEYERELKRKNRDIAIDAILYDKVEEFNNREENYSDGHISSISNVITSISVQGKNYLDLTDIYIDIMQTLDSLTSNKMRIHKNLNINHQKDYRLTDYENQMDKSRKIINNILLINSLISISSRIGPPNTIISGLDVYKYLLISNLIKVNNKGVVSGSIIGMNVIPSPYIKSNKIIMMRNNTRIENGLNVINYPNDNRYFLKETPNFEKVINWFEVI